MEIYFITNCVAAKAHYIDAIMDNATYLTHKRHASKRIAYARAALESPGLSLDEYTRQDWQGLAKGENVSLELFESHLNGKELFIWTDSGIENIFEVVSQ